jgi:hypothetical protein
MFRPSTTLKREPRFTVRLISLSPDVYISLVQIGLDRFAEALHQSTAHSFLPRRSSEVESIYFDFNESSLLHHM